MELTTPSGNLFKIAWRLENIPTSVKLHEAPNKPKIMRLTYVIFCLFLSLIGYSQSEKSLLWEISGNGLETTSYLYGTMHVSKKIAFRLDEGQREQRDRVRLYPRREGKLIEFAGDFHSHSLGGIAEVERCVSRPTTLSA